uniref:Testis development related protein n=2 Tax=Chinchilla lanigera TaxID=34839 RepID=A0A8C2W1Z3_CHILA
MTGDPGHCCRSQVSRKDGVLQLQRLLLSGSCRCLVLSLCQLNKRIFVQARLHCCFKSKGPFLECSWPCGWKSAPYTELWICWTIWVQGTSFRGWKDVTSLFNKDDEQHLLERCKSPKSKGTNLRLKEELKSEKKSGFWDNLVLKQNTQSKKPDEIEGWEPPRLALEDVAADTGDASSDCQHWSGWEGDAKGSSKYTSLSSSVASSRWSLRSAGKLVSIRRQSKGHLTDTQEDVE